MHTITVTYTLDFELNFASKYKFTKCKKCFNIKTGREIKQRLNGGSFGYYIDGKFMSLTKLRKHLVRIKDASCPF